MERFLSGLPPRLPLLTFEPDALVFLCLMVAFAALELLPVDCLVFSGLAARGWLSIDGIISSEDSCASSDGALGRLAVDGVICASSADSVLE